MDLILSGEDVLLHSETGSGKTLAFLLPLMVRRLAQARRARGAARERAPMETLVIAPTRELAIQLAQEILELEGALTGSRSNDPLQRPDLVHLVIDDENLPLERTLLRTSCPYVVGTATSLLRALRYDSTASSQHHHLARVKPHRLLQNVRHLIMDEVDRLVSPLGRYATLRDKEVRKKHPRPATVIAQAVLETSRHLRQSVQLIAASATIGRPLRRELANMMGVRDVDKGGPLLIRPFEVEEYLHSRAVGVPDTIEHFFLPLTNNTLGAKVNGLVAALRTLKPSRPLIFLAPHHSVRSLTHFLKTQGFQDTMPLHEALGFHSGFKKKTRDLRVKTSQEALAKHQELKGRFKKQDGEEAVPDAALQERIDNTVVDKNSSPPLLVASMDGARGLHFNQVDMVFVLGRPRTPDEYQHLAGRTGRQGAGGTAVIIGDSFEVRSLLAWRKMLGIDIRPLRVQGYEEKLQSFMAEESRRGEKPVFRNRDADTEREQGSAVRRAWNRDSEAQQSELEYK
ncbi:unnamed protein product [Vitrella brassicaformis CCMP3155]|uniref:ATP-dependent RNA helicase n=1 Tax=Vitrella brassicaformis (strain CCMP3155) TaxID=1169540 RepID=A0A0G4EJG7_VITBC|nr:unnamed protein product [Vitrella brassicaformis CCMP3155]|eukprot:CEL97128.1 unnamed protein product [Vitrella brassicaformis CCMP3155]